MTRDQLEHVIRAAATIADDNEIVISKYAAAREKDLAFVRTAITHGMIDESTLRRRLADTNLDAATRDRMKALIGRDFAN